MRDTNEVLAENSKNIRILSFTSKEREWVYPGYPAVIPQLAVTLTRFIFGWDNTNSEEGA